MPDTTRLWLEQVIARSGMKPTPFAQRAGIAPSTILRALDKAASVELDRRTIAKICAAFAVPPPGYGATGFAEGDLAEYAAGGDVPALPANQYRRRAASRAMELAGILAGDVLTFDMARGAAAGDIVEAQVYALDRRAAETVMRLYDPPYLIARSLDAAVPQKPLLVDGERVRIAAVLIHLARDLHNRSA